MKPRLTFLMLLLALGVAAPFGWACAVAAPQRGTLFPVVVALLAGVLVAAVGGAALQRWVIRPLEHLDRSVAAGDAHLARQVAAQQDEFGRLARFVLTSFDHQASLQRATAENARAQAALQRSETALRENIHQRARLGRDLHDGVIQALYAAGMGLAGIRTLLRPEQTEAAVRIEQTRALLNEAIHDVRNFIIGLEPEALKLQSFSQTVVALLDGMRGMRNFESEVNVDDTLASRLTLAQRVHALQIAREAASNALRHGGARRVDVTFRPHEHFAEFTVSDDGAGFDPALSTSGRGLQNFAERARELGATCDVNTQRGKGTRVILRLSLPPP